MERVLSVVAFIIALSGASAGNVMDSSKLDKMADALISNLGDDGMVSLEKFLQTMSGNNRENVGLQDEDNPGLQQEDLGGEISNEMMTKLANEMADVGEDGKIMEGDDDDSSLLSQALIQDDKLPATNQGLRYVRISHKVWLAIRHFYWVVYRKYARRWRG